jgi:hypothetical protein
MLHLRAIRLYTLAASMAAILGTAAPARAQFKPQPLSDPATGEKYHIEGGVAYWFPSADIVIASSQFDIVGTSIDLKRDLGLTDQHFPEMQLTLRPTKGQKLRFQFIPINYTQSAVLRANIVFNGQNYSVGVPVNSTLDWKAYRFSYEYDFLVKNRWFAGFIAEAKYTDVQVNLSAPGPLVEFAHASAPIPALGGIGRFYVVPNISITGEVTGFKLPDSIDTRYAAHYVDVDIYGTVNFTNNIGAQLGYRSLDVGYLVKTDTGSLTLQGLYFGAVLRY